MNDQIDHIDQTDDEIFITTVPDEALEAAAGMERAITWAVLCTHNTCVFVVHPDGR
jgi:hypothetical protein